MVLPVNILCTEQFLFSLIRLGPEYCECDLVRCFFNVTTELYFMHIDNCKQLYRFISTFLTTEACCRNIEIVLHLTTLSFIYICYICCTYNSPRLILLGHNNTCIVIDNVD